MSQHSDAKLLAAAQNFEQAGLRTSGRQADVPKMMGHLTKASLVSAIWLSFCVLLEQSYKTDYKLEIMRIQEFHRRQDKEKEEVW